MTSVTIDELQSRQDELAKLIEQFKAQTPCKTAGFAVTLAPFLISEGETYIGTIVAADRRYHLVLVPGEQEPTTWHKAMDWAKSIGAELPDRVEMALLFATAKSHFKESYHWTRETYAGTSVFAWIATFSGGYQTSGLKDRGYRARAVRRVLID